VAFVPLSIDFALPAHSRELANFTRIDVFAQSYIAHFMFQFGIHSVIGGKYAEQYPVLILKCISCEILLD
jgi:hypothetical protein